MHYRILSSWRSLLTAGIILIFAAGCAPSMSPLYRDYETPPAEKPAVLDSVRLALRQAGWELAPSSSPAHAVTTETKTLSNWGLYKTKVSLEVLPVGGRHIRLYFHPYRSYITGGQSKIMYLSSSLQEELLPPLNESFKEKGLRLVGTPFDTN